MISYSENFERDRQELLTLEEEHALFERRDLLLESLDGYTIYDERKVQLQSELRDLIAGVPTDIIRQRIDNLAGQVATTDVEMSYCSDELSLTVIYMTIQEHFFPLVKKLARSHQYPGVDIKDLWQRAVIGLQEAIFKYQTSRLTFGRFASWIIRNSMKEELQATMGPLRMPKQMVKQFKTITKAFNDHWQEHHDTPTTEQLASKADTGKSAARAFLMSQLQTATVDENFVSECESPRKEVASKEMAGMVHRMIDSVSDEKSKKVLSLYYGVGSNHQLTLQEIATSMGYKSRINVFQVKEKALSELRRRYQHLHDEVKDSFSDLSGLTIEASH